MTTIQLKSASDVAAVELPRLQTLLKWPAKTTLSEPIMVLNLGVNQFKPAPDAPPGQANPVLRKQPSAVYVPAVENGKIVELLALGKGPRGEWRFQTTMGPALGNAIIQAARKQPALGEPQPSGKPYVINVRGLNAEMVAIPRGRTLEITPVSNNDFIGWRAGQVLTEQKAVQLLESAAARRNNAPG